jgi:hypothetical protein
MSTGINCGRIVEVFFLCAVMCAASLNAIDSASTHSRKAKKPQLAPLPSGPTGPVPQMPLDSIKPVAPQVSFENGQLTIVASNSTLGDILRAVRKQTGAEIDIPDAQDRVVTHLGPGPARAIVAELLNGSRFNYVLLGSPENANQLTRVVLVARSDNGSPSNAAKQPGVEAANAAQPEVGQDASDSDSPDDNAINSDDNSNSVEQPAAEVEQPAQPEQPGVKTPQQMLQEMQQRQMQFQQQQQQQQSGPPMPTPGMPVGIPRPPQPPDQ